MGDQPLEYSKTLKLTHEYQQKNVRTPTRQYKKRLPLFFQRNYSSASQSFNQECQKKWHHTQKRQSKKAKASINTWVCRSSQMETHANAQGKSSACLRILRKVLQRFGSLRIASRPSARCRIGLALRSSGESWFRMAQRCVHIELC